ncbi:MAG: family 20 glycosylhydrolase, partial [Bacteroidaceae bacterium]|nr:family 20 glycosylhydrolase [Bacteroidaceae bacterium]
MTKFKRTFILTLIAVWGSLVPCRIIADNVLLPQPKQIAEESGRFKARQVNILSPVLEQQWKAFATEIGWEIDSTADATISVNLVDKIPQAEDAPKEAYRLHIDKRRIAIEAVSDHGVWNAMQTLRQLVSKERQQPVVKCCDITDWPAFPIRGFMQDVGRSYISLDELKREIAILSKFKINVFHWHLTENQAWRLQSKIFPMLNDSINTIRMPGKYYTLAEARELVEFCKAHHVLLIPEIDMPGHSAAFVRTFRHDMQSAEGMKILKLLIDEVCETFHDLPYLHIGTDEVRFTNPNFVPEMVSYIRAKGKKVISWNPGWNYKPGEIDMTQLWSFRGKATPGIPAIDCKYHYVNHFDTFGDIIALYHSTIYGKQKGDKDVVGSIIALWHDRLMKSEHNQMLENGLYPHTLALAERAWMGGGSEYFNGDGTNLTEEDTEKFKAFADFERRMLWHKEHTFAGYPFGYVKQTQVKWNITDAFPNGGDLSKRFPPEDQTAEQYQHEGKIYGVRQATGAGIYLRHVWGSLGSNSVPTFYKDAKENHTAYAYTWVYSIPCSEHGARSRRDRNLQRFSGSGRRSSPRRRRSAPHLPP